MKVFITGAAGFIGQATSRALIAKGHTVLGLARSDNNAKALTDLGASVRRGDLTDLESLKAGAAEADAVVHLAFQHDFKDYAAACAADYAAISAIGKALEGSDKPLIVTSGTLSLKHGQLCTEADRYDEENMFAKLRGPSETLTLSLAEKGVKAMVIRLSPTNHGVNDRGFVKILVESARKNGESIYVGDGEKVWPAVHKEDTARLYVKVLERGEAGRIYHSVAEQGVKIKDIAQVIGEKLVVPAKGHSLEEAQGKLGFLAMALAGDNPVSSRITKEELGWAPKEVGLLDDLKQDHYYRDYKSFDL